MFLVGDVSGKGIGAALLMSSFLASARAFYETCSDPGELATWLGDIVYANGDPSRFVTGFLGCLDTRTGTLHYANAGHPSAVLLAGGEMRQLESTGVPFGVLPNFRYGSGSTEICPGQMLAVFSDGIPEAQRGEEFFSDERLHQALVAASGARDLSDVRRSVLARLEAFLGDTPHSDDITLFLVRRELGQT
jgi:sigma-B regulation protein RsbU (phosphoserine phosphatase)